METSIKRKKMSKKKLILTILTIGFFIIPGAMGFINKFREFILLANDEEGSFTLMPILNYLCASFGFFMLFIWATYQGMFYDVEEPKRTMLERENLLDDQEKKLHHALLVDDVLFLRNQEVDPSQNEAIKPV